MTKARFATYIFAGLTALVLLPAPASASSAITGVVRDTSGAVMPNVTVEAASPALIEKSHTVTTDGQGRYSIIDLRPGTYTVTFAMPGFKTLRRDGIEVPADVSIPLYVEMSVGAIGETVEVQAVAPVVDVQSTAHTIIQDREFMDYVPSSRTFQQLAGFTPGIRLTPPAVGVSHHMDQTHLPGHGSCAEAHTRVLDGVY